MDSESAKIKINAALEIRPWEIRNRYRRVSALLIYWEDGDDVGYKQEAGDVHAIFRQDFHFEVEYYAIPTRKSFLELDKRINLLLKSCGFEDNLIIMYYGGHGDPNDQAGEDQLAVWAAQAKGGPTLNWSTIQYKLAETKADVLLLLDCCFAAQAVRANPGRVIPPNMELLAACAMNVKTVSPGPTSFTTLLVKFMKTSLKQKGSVRISDLVNLIGSERSGFGESPLHYSGFGDGKSTIALKPLVVESTNIDVDKKETAWLNLRVSLRDTLADALITDIIEWLRAHPKHKISRLKVEDIGYSVNTLQAFIYNEGQGPQSRPKLTQLSDSAQQDVVTKWTELQSLLAGLATQLRSRSLLTTNGTHECANVSTDHETASITASNTLPEIERTLLSLQAIVQRSVMALPQFTSRESLLEAIADRAMQDLGFLPLLEQRVKALFDDCLDPRLKITHETSTCPESSSDPHGLMEDSINNLGTVLVEHKYYDNSSRIGQVERQVAILANLLQSPESPDFQTLHCRSWFHEASESRFGLVFDYPHGCDEFISLHEIIRSKGQKQRPSLGQRFSIVKNIGEAMLKWHTTANWVHQGISSRNVYFFKSAATEHYNYGKAYLCGFECSRPSQGISNNAYVEDFDRNVYRHPDRQGEPSEYHTKKHDLYAFGVLLLEVGVWALVASFFTEHSKVNLAPNRMRQHIRSCATRRLGQSMGLAYERATLRCLDMDLGVQSDDAMDSKLAKAFQVQILDVIDRGTTLD